MNGISSVTDCPRSGQAHPVAVEAIVKENRHITVNEDYSEWRLQWTETAVDGDCNGRRLQWTENAVNGDYSEWRLQ